MKTGRQGLRHVGRLRGRELDSRPSRGLGAADCWSRGWAWLDGVRVPAPPAGHWPGAWSEFLGRSEAQPSHLPHLDLRAEGGLSEDETKTHRARAEARTATALFSL